MKKILYFNFLAIILTYIAAMKMKCGYCTNIPETGYVTVLSIIILVQAFLFSFFPDQGRSMVMKNKWLLLTLAVINVANIIYLYRFIGKMNESQCRECSDEWRRTFLYYYSTFVLITYAIYIVFMIVSFPYLINSSCRHCKH
mgnify:FL=1